MSEENEQGTGFSADYVKELRQENAGWRTKVRDLESQVKTNDVSLALAKKGVSVDPTWVKMNENETTDAAVDRFLTEYPQFTTQEQVEPVQPQKPVLPKVMTPNAPVTNDKGNRPMSATGREIVEIKKDPKAREALRGHYRELLLNSSNQGD